MGRRTVVLAVVAALTITATANAAPGWVPGSDEVAVSANSSNIATPKAVVTPDLRTVAVWAQGVGVHAAIRPRGGPFGDPFEVDPGDGSFVPQFLNAAALPGGDVLITWSGPDFNYPAYAKLLHPDGTVDNAVSIEAGGFHPAVAVNSAGRIALAYYTFNEVKLLVRPAGSTTFDSAVSLLALSSNPLESPNSLDVTLRDSDGQLTAAIGTKGVNPTSPAQARIVIVRRTAAGVNSTEAVESQTLSLSVPAGQSESGQYDGQIKQLSDGNQVLVYRKSHIAANGTQTREIHGGKRTGSGTNGMASPTIDSGNFNNFPSEHGLVVDDAGRPSTWWRNDLGADKGLRISRASTDGVFGASQKLAADTFGAVGFDAFGDGRTGLLFTQDGKEQASLSEAGGPFSTPVVVATPTSVPAGQAKVALAGAGEGSAVAIWPDGIALNTTALEATPFDATPPVLGTLQAPDTLTAGVAGTFSTSAADDWSTPSISWLFSDGATQPGPSVDHAFAAPGSFTATATATDAVGNSAPSSARTVTVTPAPTPVTETTPGDNSPPPVATAPTDTTPPAIKLALTKQKLLTALKKGYFAFFLDNEAGNGVADLFASGRDAKGAAVRKRVAHGTLTVTKTGKQKLVLKFTRKAKKAFKTRRKVTLALVLVVTDAAGNATTKTAKVVLKR